LTSEFLRNILIEIFPRKPEPLQVALWVVFNLKTHRKNDPGNSKGSTIFYVKIFPVVTAGCQMHEAEFLR
jgi:hypothetical protein